MVLVTRLVHQLGADGQGSLKPSGDQHNKDGWRFAHIHIIRAPVPCTAAAAAAAALSYNYVAPARKH